VAELAYLPNLSSMVGTIGRRTLPDTYLKLGIPYLCTPELDFHQEGSVPALLPLTPAQDLTGVLEGSVFDGKGIQSKGTVLRTHSSNFVRTKG